MSPTFDLLLITDGRPELTTRVVEALSGAMPEKVALVLREPQLGSAALLALARELREHTRAAGALLLVSDRVDIALASAADGVHLPERGFCPADARALLGPRALVGVSRHSAEGLARAAVERADYASLSPVHEVADKAPPLGLAGFGSLTRAARLPVYALGGVRLEDVAALRKAGARGIAVMREVLAAANPGRRVEQLLLALSAG